MTQIKLRRDTSANFTSKNPVLGIGEPAYETDTKKLKIGDGATAYNNLDYFAGGGGSTEFTVVQPLKLVDGTLTLQIDEQTIQVQNGKLVANLDELGNEVNTLAGDVTGVQADLLKKEDKLTVSNPIIKTEEEKANQVGYTVSGTTLTANGRYSVEDFSNQSGGIYVYRDYTGGTEDNYVDIPFELGDIIKIPYTQAYYYVSNGFFGFINDDGMFRPVTKLYETNSGYQSRYDTVSTNDYKQQYFLNSTDKVNRTHTYTTVTTKATDGYRYVQLRDGGNNTVVAIVGSFDDNTSIAKQIWSKTDDSGVNYEKLLKCNVLRMYPYGNQSDTVDTSFDASQFGLYKGLGKLEDLAPNFEAIEAATNQFDVLGTTKINNLSLSIDSSLVVNSDGKLGLSTASANTIGGVKVGEGLAIASDGTLSSSGGGSTSVEKHGLEGDYCSKYGIVDCPNGILEKGTRQVTLKAGVVMQMTETDGLTTNASDMPHDITSTVDFDLFYTSGSLLEATQVVFSEQEPEDGATGVLAWYNGTQWQFKSNDTGNVWKAAPAVRLAHIHITNGNITRIDYIGNRHLNKVIPVTVDTTQTISGAKTFGDKIIFNNTDSEASEQTTIRGGEFSLGTFQYDNTIKANNLTLNASTTNQGTFKVLSSGAILTQITGNTITSQKTDTKANKIMATIRPSSASSNKNYSVLYSEVDSNYKHKLTINNLSSDLVLAGKTVKDSSGNTFLTSGNVAAHVTEEFINGTEGYRLWSNGRCEQWGSFTGPKTITFLKNYTDTNYTLLVSVAVKTSGEAYNGVFGTEKTTTGFKAGGLAGTTGDAYIISTTGTCDWYTSGTLAS